MRQALTNTVKITFVSSAITLNQADGLYSDRESGEVPPVIEVVNNLLQPYSTVKRATHSKETSFVRVDRLSLANCTTINGSQLEESDLVFFHFTQAINNDLETVIITQLLSFSALQVSK